MAAAGAAGAASPLSPPQAVVFPPPTALAATGEGVTAASPLARQAETASPPPARAAARVEERAPAATIKPEVGGHLFVSLVRLPLHSSVLGVHACELGSEGPICTLLSGWDAHT